MTDAAELLNATLQRLEDVEPPRPTVDVPAAALNATLAKLEGGAAAPAGPAGPTLAPPADNTLPPLRWDGATWNRRDNTTRRNAAGDPVNMFDEAIPERPIDTGWLISAIDDRRAGVVLDRFDTNPETGEQVDTFVYVLVTERGTDLQRVVVTVDSVLGAQPPHRQAVREACQVAAQQYARRLRRRSADVDGTDRWLLMVVDRLTAVLEQNGWRR